jgi:hypothetical protein
MDKTIEQRIEEAIVARFFEPSWVFSTQVLYSNSGQVVGSTITPMQNDAPMSTVAKAIYDAAKDELVLKVIESINIDEIVESWAPKIAEDVVKKLNETPGWNAKPGSSEREKMLDKVYNQVADEFGRQCVEHLKNTGGLMRVLEGGEPSDDVLG